MVKVCALKWWNYFNSLTNESLDAKTLECQKVKDILRVKKVIRMADFEFKRRTETYGIEAGKHIAVKPNLYMCAHEMKLPLHR